MSLDREWSVNVVHTPATVRFTTERVVLYTIDRVTLKTLLHHNFEAARLDIGVEDRFGHLGAPPE